MRGNPLVVAGSMFALLMSLGALFIFLRSDGGSSVGAEQNEGAQTGGDPIGCSGGQPVRAVTSVDGDRFQIVGSLTSFSGRDFMVKTPDGSVDLVLATDADIGGQFLAGDWIAASGKVDGDKWEATTIRQPCSNAIVGAAPDGTGGPTPLRSGPLFPGFTSAPHSAEPAQSGQALGETQAPVPPLDSPSPGSEPTPEATRPPGTPPATSTTAPTPSQAATPPPVQSSTPTASPLPTTEVHS